MKKEFTDLDNIAAELSILEQLGNIRTDIYDELERYGYRSKSDGTLSSSTVVYELLRVLPQLIALNYSQREVLRKIQNDITTRNENQN